MSRESIIKIGKNKSLVKAVALDLLKDAEQEHKINGKFSENSLQALHSVFGDVLIRATELLENHKVFVYHLEDFSRKLIKLIGRREQYILFCDINFCHCDTFKNDVLEGHAIVCEHILAVKLAEICGNIKNVIVTDLQMKEMLDDVVKDLKIVL